MLQHVANPLLKSTLRRRRVLESACSDKIIYRCNNCVRRDRECKIGINLDSYIKCFRVSLSYKLAFSEAKLCRIRKKRREKLEAVYCVVS